MLLLLTGLVNISSSSACICFKYCQAGFYEVFASQGWKYKYFDFNPFLKFLKFQQILKKWENWVVCSINSKRTKLKSETGRTQWWTDLYFEKKIKRTYYIIMSYFWATIILWKEDSRYSRIWLIVIGLLNHSKIDFWIANIYYFVEPIHHNFKSPVYPKYGLSTYVQYGVRA